MTLRLTTDPEVIASVLDPLIEADPVRGTVLGTIRLGLTSSAWCAWDGASVAVRSADAWPVALAGPWAEVAELARALARVDGVRGVAGEQSCVHRVVAALGRPVSRQEQQRLYRCETLVEPVVTGSPRVALEADRTLVRRWFAAFSEEAHGEIADAATVADAALDGGGCLLWRSPDGHPVSMAARRPVVAGSARVGPVFTPPSARGHGYASGVTAAATRSILDEGAVPVLFTDLANPTTNRIYPALGYVPVQDRLSVTF